MSDRSSQYIFSVLFDFIGKNTTPETAALAKKMWKVSTEFDFHPGDMDVDEVLIALGLAKKGVDKNYPEDGPITLYKGRDYK